MFKVYQRVCSWNAARYDRVFSSKLTLRLLREEYNEWLTAPEKVDELDALCDIIYVGLGTAWKLDIGYNALEDGMSHSARVVLNMVNLNEINPAFLISTHLDVLEHDLEYPALGSMCMIIQAALTQMIGMGLTNAQVLEALNIVCDSNDTKQVEKVKPNVKANANKGELFIAPEPRLQKVLNNVKRFN